MSSARVQALAACWETLSPAKVDELGRWYTEDVQFRDPFHETRGLVALQAILHRMFVRLEDPRFTVREAIEQDDRALLVWDFHFEGRRIHGSSLVRFAPDGRVHWHRDYWDAAGELYAQLPVLGGLMRWLARRIAGG